MSLTLFTNDKRRKYLGSNRPEGRVGHSLHHYYELSATKEVSGSSGRDDDEGTGQTRAVDRMNDEQSYALDSGFTSTREEGKCGPAEISGRNCGDHVGGEQREGEESLRGNPEETYKEDKLFTQCPSARNHYKSNDDHLGSIPHGEKKKKGYHNRFIHGRYKVVLFGGGLPEEEFVRNYENGCVQAKGEEEDGEYSKYNMMSVENSLQRTLNDLYICEEENDDFEHWVNVKTHNVPEARAFHASCIVNLGLNGVFLFIHGGKVNNDMLADDRLCALNLSRISYRAERSQSGSRCRGEPDGEEESDTSNSPMVEQKQEQNRTECNDHPDESEEEHLPHGNPLRENQHGLASSAVIKEDRNEKDEQSDPPNEGPQNGVVKNKAEEEKQQGEKQVEEEETFGEPLPRRRKSCEAPRGADIWGNSNHHGEEGHPDVDIGPGCLKEEPCRDAEPNAAGLEAPPKQRNHLANHKKRKWCCSSSHLCSASSESASRQSSSMGSPSNDSPSSSSSSSNSLPPCDSAFFRSTHYHTRDNQLDEEDEDVLVNSRVPVKSLLLRGNNNSSCGSASSPSEEEDSDVEQGRNGNASLKRVKRTWVHVQTVGRKPNSRYGHTLDFLYPHLVLFGGNEHISDDEETFFCKNDLWVLNIKKGKRKCTKSERKKTLYFAWQEVEYQSVNPLGRYFHATTVWYDVKNKMNKLILYGGKMRKKTSVSNRLLALQNYGNKWRWSILPVYVDPLNENRACHALVCVDNHIFIIGGEDYTYKYIEKMPSALYSFESKKFQYINDFSVKACLKCFAKNETIYSWGGFTDVSCNQIFLPNNFVTIDVNPHVMYIQMKEDLADEYDENNDLVLKEEPESDDDIYHRMNKRILKVHNRKMELEKDLLYQIKLNENLNFRIKSQMVQYQRVLQLLNVKQTQNAHLMSAFKQQSLPLDGGTIGGRIGGNFGGSIGGSVAGCHIASHGSYHSLHGVPLYDAGTNINMSSINVSSCSNYPNYNSEGLFKMSISEQDNFSHPIAADMMSSHASGLQSEYECNVVRHNVKTNQTVSELPVADAGGDQNMLSNENIQSISYTDSMNEKGNKNVEEQEQLRFEGGIAPDHVGVPINQVSAAGENPPCGGYHPSEGYASPGCEQVTSIPGSAPYHTFSGMSELCATNGGQLPWNGHTSGYSNGASHPYSEMNQLLDMTIKNSTPFVNDYFTGNPLDVPQNNLQASGSNDRIGNASSTQRGVLGNEKEGSTVTAANNESLQAQSEGNSTNRESSNQRVRRKTAAKCLELIEQDRLSRMMSER
ncbi:hypothetical protein C922_03162 [Plasmodium inui San Antonio 1]|uniref:Kelch domain-containing protein n=1 Tax=Plasmodium inui San Antonio 1 TaxID=1237626 RepID=W7A5P0_9APIC|nr:hypothetical protein C922_03162 [Plasmodium inui San Antonio 1]EUD66528.1 hypothetical protein C922_03162 [Plasmodium inui San Antonio 1]